MKTGANCPLSVLRVDIAVDLQSSRTTALCYLGTTSGLVSGLQSYLLAGGGASSPGGSSLPTDSPPSHLPTEEELEEDYYGSTAHPGLYQHIYGHPGSLYSKSCSWSGPAEWRTTRSRPGFRKFEIPIFLTALYLWQSRKGYTMGEGRYTPG